MYFGYFVCDGDDDDGSDEVTGVGRGRGGRYWFPRAEERVVGSFMALNVREEVGIVDRRVSVSLQK